MEGKAAESADAGADGCLRVILLYRSIFFSVYMCFALTVKGDFFASIGQSAPGEDVT
jgi:hypothetical protein